MTTVRRFSDFAIGDTIWFDKVFELDAAETFATVSGDWSPLHCDPEYARATPFGNIILPVLLSASPLSAIAGMAFPGESSLCLEQVLRAHLPIYYGDKLVYSAQITSITAASRVLLLRVCVFRELDLVLEAKMTVQARSDEWSSPPAWEILKAARKRTCLVTGAGGAIGLATAKLLAAHGWSLILHHRSGSPERIAAECISDGKIEVVQADLATAGGREHLANIAAASDLDAIVHCASAPIDAPIEDLFATNFTAFQMLRDAALGPMLRKQDGRFILLGSQAVDLLPRNWSGYVAAKAAAQTIVDGIERHYGKLGVSAGTLAPSYVQSSFSDGWRTSNEPAILPEFVASHVMQMLEQDHSVYRMLNAVGARDRGVAYETAEAAVHGRELTPTAPETQAHARNGFVGESSRRLDQVIRKTLKLPETYDLSEAGLGLTPAWDSLAHIQLILAIEQELGVRFNSQEIAHLLAYADLKSTCEQKLHAVTA